MAEKRVVKLTEDPLMTVLMPSVKVGVACGTSFLLYLLFINIYISESRRVRVQQRGFCMLLNTVLI